MSAEPLTRRYGDGYGTVSPDGTRYGTPRRPDARGGRKPQHASMTAVYLTTLCSMPFSRTTTRRSDALGGRTFKHTPMTAVHLITLCSMSSS